MVVGEFRTMVWQDLCDTSLPLAEPGVCTGARHVGSQLLLPKLKTFLEVLSEAGFRANLVTQDYCPYSWRIFSQCVSQSDDQPQHQTMDDNYPYPKIKVYT